MNILLLTNRNCDKKILNKFKNVSIEKITECNPDIDLVISYCYNFRIKEPLISGPKYGCINFHPAPLPEYKGLAVYNFAILNEESKWGVTCHYVNEKFDEGDIISQTNFDLGRNHTADSLRSLSHTYLHKELNKFLNNKKHFLNKSRKPQEKRGNYYSREMLEKERVVDIMNISKESKHSLDKKIRAFYCPPHKGFSIKIGDDEYELKYNKNNHE
tara:strand:+ start:1972 stop:2616 length:645 start_codon:yes stop_codon:yes gene_type:complete